MADLDKMKLSMAGKRADDSARPCPFCGSEEIAYGKYEHAAGERYAILCMNCMAQIDPGWAQSWGAVQELWNRRTDSRDPNRNCEHCRHMTPSNKTNRLFCSYHSEGEHQYEVFSDEYCSYFERAESNRGEHNG